MLIKYLLKEDTYPTLGNKPLRQRIILKTRGVHFDRAFEFFKTTFDKETIYKPFNNQAEKKPKFYLEYFEHEALKKRLNKSVQLRHIKVYVKDCLLSPNGESWFINNFTAP